MTVFQAGTGAVTDQPGTLPLVVFRTLTAICDIIIPADEKSGAASDAGVPQFLDYVASHSKTYHRRIVGGIIWLNSFCSVHYEVPFLLCGREQQKEVIDLIAFRRNAGLNPSLLPGIEFFAFLRRTTLNAFYTSRLGVTDLDYRGNKVMAEFLGCPVEPKCPGNDSNNSRVPGDEHDIQLEPGLQKA